MTFNTKTTKLRDAISFALVVGVTGLAGTGVAFAQEDDSNTDSNAQTLDRYEVTGSRLKRAEIEGSLPVTVIDRAQIEASGEVSVADYLRSTNFSSTGQFRPQSGSSAQAGAFADLKGLGSQRTLVLIDGHRAPKSPFAASSQDLNVIPLAAIERIEILTDGASAVYGADAVGGVINIITRKDFNGASLTIGKSFPKWGETDEASAIMGVSGERGRIVGGFSTNRRGMIYTNERPWGQTRGASPFGNNFLAFDPATGALLSRRQNGSPNGDPYSPVPGGCTNENFYLLDAPGTAANGRCVYDFNKVAADEASTTQKSFFANGEYDINDDWSVYLRTSVANTKSFGRYAPTPGVVFIAPDAAQNPIPGANTYLYHRFAAAGNRDNNTDANVYDINLGFNGTVGDSVDVNFGVRYNTYKYLELGRNYIVGSLAEAAINSGAYNIYDPGSTPVDVLNSIKATISRDSQFTTEEAYGSVAFNDLFELGGGSSGLVIGAEYREETFVDLYDSLSSADVVLGSSGASAGGGRQVSALYAEWLLPITSTFEVNVAGRYEDYSDYGNNFAPKVSVRFQPIDSLTLRASVGRGFVAPTLDVITQETAFSADTVFDPATCLFNGDIDGTKVGAGKKYATGADYCAATGGLNGIQVDSFREKATNLSAEKSEQYQFGVVWDAADWLSFTVDYYNIKIEDRIAFYSSQKLINIDIGDDPTPFPGAPCSLARNPNAATPLGNALDELHNCYFNEGEVKVRGVDATIRTTFDMGDWGALSNLLAVSYVDSYTIDGGEEQTGLQGFPDTRATLNNNWRFGDLTLGYNIRYIGDNGEGTNATASFTTHDLQLSYNTPWNGKVTLGVNNVADKLPQLISFDGRPFNFNLYDAYGRSPYVRYEQNF